MKEIKLNLEGMACYTSENRIKTGLGYLDGVVEIYPNCMDQSLICKYDDSIVSETDILARLEEMEFRVK